MKRIRIIAILSAVITALAVYLYLASLNKPVEIQRGPVVVALTQIKSGQEITADMVEVKNLPVEAITANAARSTDEVIGRISNARTEPGEQMLVSRFMMSGETADTLAYAVEKGKRAFTIPVDMVSGLAGLLHPRDSVDILLIIGVVDSSQVPEATQLTTTYSQILLQNILVLATGGVMDPAAGSATGEAAETVTLSVTPEQAVGLNLALAEGSIRLVLRSPIDSAEVNVKSMQVKDIVD